MPATRTAQGGNTGSGIQAYTDTVGNIKRSYLRINNVEVWGFKESGIVIGACPADRLKLKW